MIRHFMLSTLFFSALISGGLKYWAAQEVARHPSAAPETYSLHISNVRLGADSHVKDLNDFFVRATFDHQHVVEFGKDQSWSIKRGDNMDLNLKLAIQREWIRDDQLNFKIEVLSKRTGFLSIEQVVVRCQQVSKEVTQYNRSFQCNIPNEQTPFLSYRLFKEGSPELKVAGSAN